MNGVHDLGGMHGFGPVLREESEPAFHEAWEGVVFSMMRAARAQKLFNGDESRHGIERIAPALPGLELLRALARVAGVAGDRQGLRLAGELDARTEEYASGERDDDEDD